MYTSDLIPIMTSNTTPSGVASASSEFHAGTSAYKALDDDSTNTYWLGSNGGVDWLKYDFGSGNLKKIAKYTLRMNTIPEPNRAPKNWTFEGSNNDSDWDILDTQTNQINWGSGERRDFIFANVTFYRYYRLNVTANNGDATYTQVRDMEMMAKELFEVEQGETLNLTEGYEANLDLEKVEQEETFNLLEDYNIKKLQKIEQEESLSLAEDLEFQLTKITEIEEAINLSEDTFLNLSKEFHEQNETLNLTESYEFLLSVVRKFLTNLKTKLLKQIKFITNLVTNIRTYKKYLTKLYLKGILTKKYSTDLRLRVSDYDLIQPGTLDDIVVKLDGDELTDVDYSTLKITYRLNRTPSFATFILGRRHDDINRQLDGTSSEINNENKIEIYDNNIKLFTGYITTINAISDSDTVQITAEDIRYKISKQSMELWYGGIYERENNLNIEYSKSTAIAIEEVLSEISTLISGYDSITFGNQFIPEYVKRYDNCAVLLDDLIKNSGNINWYVDADEYIKFQKIGQGTIKTLSLSSLDVKRHLYDVVIDNIVLDRKTENYIKSLEVKLGDYIKRKWGRVSAIGYTELPTWFLSKDERTIFCFQTYLGSSRYVGINVTIHGYYDIGEQKWILLPRVVGQYLLEDSIEELSGFTIGSLEPQKTLNLTNYGKKETNWRYEEITYDSSIHGGLPGTSSAINGEVWLTMVKEEQYNYESYAQDVANFELNQNNQLFTQANITLILDAFNYYNIRMNERINIENTIETDIYNNNNGFPLNIDSITIDCSRRLVTLNLTNSGKNWYERTGSYLNNYIPEQREFLRKKKAVLDISLL